MSTNTAFTSLNLFRTFFSQTNAAERTPEWPEESSSERQILSLLFPFIEKSFLDVGARKGDFATWLNQQGLRGTLIEPLSVFKGALEKVSHEGRNKFLCCSVSDRSEQKKFWLQCDEKGDLQNVLEQSDGTGSKPQNAIELTVDCMSLEELELENKVPRKTGLIRLNSTGDDIRVLHGMGRVRSDVLICRYHRLAETETGCGQTERLVSLARMLDYRQCLAVRRRGDAELITMDPMGFVDEESGSLIFLSGKAYENAKSVIGQFLVEKDRDTFNTVNGQISRWRN